MHDPVHLGGAGMHIAHGVDAAGEEEDALGERGLARVDVGHDADVAIALDSGVARHKDFPFPAEEDPRGLKTDHWLEKEGAAGPAGAHTHARSGPSGRLRTA